MDRIALLTEVLSQNPTDAFARYGLAMEYSKLWRSRTGDGRVWQAVGDPS